MGCENWMQNQKEVAEYLKVSEEYLQESLIYYYKRYGPLKFLDNYWVCFIPTLQVYEYEVV